MSTISRSGNVAGLAAGKEQVIISYDEMKVIFAVEPVLHTVLKRRIAAG